MDTNEAQNSMVTTDTTWTGDTESAVTVATGAILAINGSHEGPLTVESLGTVIISGDVVGPVEVRVAGTVVIEAGGRVVGPITNFGSVTNRGLRAGRVEGREPDDQPGSETVPMTAAGETAGYRLPPRG